MSLPLEFGQPWALLLLPLVLVPMGYLARTTKAPLGGLRWWLSTGIRVGLVLLLVLSLADLRWARRSSDLCVFFLVDGSKSTGPLEDSEAGGFGDDTGRALPRALKAARKQIVGELLQMKDGDRFGVIVFGQSRLDVLGARVLELTAPALGVVLGPDVDLAVVEVEPPVPAAQHLGQRLGPRLLDVEVPPEAEGKSVDLLAVDYSGQTLSLGQTLGHSVLSNCRRARLARC